MWDIAIMYFPGWKYIRSVFARLYGSIVVNYQWHRNEIVDSLCMGKDVLRDRLQVPPENEMEYL